MAELRGNREAFGQPGIPPKWSPGDKDGVGTAYSIASRIWYTLWKGSVTEVYYPTVDSPRTRDWRLLLSDGKSFCRDETSLDIKIEHLGETLGHKVTGRDEGGAYSFEKEIITDPYAPCVLQRVRISDDGSTGGDFKVYALCSPHIGGGWGNTAEVLRVYERDVLVAHNGIVWMAMASTTPFAKSSAGYVGVSDGWTDIAAHFGMEWQFDHAPNGNVALVGELELENRKEFTLALAFGDSQHAAITTLGQSLAVPFDEKLAKFQEQWGRAARTRKALESHTGDEGALYRNSHRILLAHEDKLFSGAMVASLAIPWGESKDDHEGKGGYHLIWTRDMVHSAMGLIAAGNTATPLRSLLYLACTQHPDGGFAQNFWVTGEAFWANSQMDEVAFPILLAHRLWRENALGDFDPLPIVKKAIGYLVREGPATRQERWEEMGGFSPSTLAAVIAALICGAELARNGGHEEEALMVEQYADWLERNLEKWTVTHQGDLVAGISTHYIRILPHLPGTVPAPNAPDTETLSLTSQPPGAPNSYSAKMIVDAGFLEFVRYGIRRADDPIIVDSLKVVDAVLKADTPSGTAWKRYNHDGYGQRADGGPYEGFGQGRPWALLAGERGHYELAAGGDAGQHARWMEGFATSTLLIPEQSWDEADRTELGLRFGRPTGSATPLVWAHAEYICLLRSIADGQVFDRIPAVAKRYLTGRPAGPLIEFWTFAYPEPEIAPGETLRIVVKADFELTYSLDDWASVQRRDATATDVGIYFAEVAIPKEQQSPFRFTFYWKQAGNWEGRDFTVTMRV